MAFAHTDGLLEFLQCGVIMTSKCSCRLRYQQMTPRWHSNLASAITALLAGHRTPTIAELQQLH
jgi:hypothetical protein